MQKLTTLPALAAQAYDALALPVWLFSSETLNIVAANKAAQTWLGYDEQTLKTMTVADLRPESERELVTDRVRCFNDVQGHAGTWTIIAKSGDRYTVSFHWTKVLFDGAPTIVASIQDITQATQVQAHARTLAANIQALQTKVTLTTEHFARLFDAVPGKMLVLTPNDYTIVAVTDDYAKAVSSDRTTLIGRRLFEAFPDDKERLDNALHKVITGEHAGFNEQYRFRRADGSWATIEDRAFGVRNDDGKVVRVLGNITDISQQLQLERRLQQAQKMEAVGQLTGGVAHDFNNLLTVIVGNSELLYEELADRPDLQAIAKMVGKAGARGAELTNRLLAFSRRQARQPRVTHVGSLIQGMESMLKRTLPESIDIAIRHADALWNTEIDAGQLESALLNLTLNARDAMPDGGCLTIETANVEFDGNYAANEPEIEPGPYVQIVITDTGLGIPADILGRIFEPFFTTKDVGKGSGLGLSMVYGFVKQSGGHIRVYSEPGEGTCFKLYFPRSYAKDEPAAGTETGQTITKGKETVLVVEDDSMVRAHVISLLKNLGYNVMQASNGAEALELVKGGPHIDLLFTDVVMPGGMGERALAEAALAVRAGLKVLFTSGYTQNSIVHNGKLDAGVELLGKPYRREQLAVKLRQVLERK